MTQLYDEVRTDLLLDNHHPTLRGLSRSQDRAALACCKDDKCHMNLRASTQ